MDNVSKQLQHSQEKNIELHTEEKAIFNFKKNPKQEWLRMKGQKHYIVGDISLEDMLAYGEQLYVHQGAKGMPDMSHNNQTEECFNAMLVTKGLKRLANGKAPDTLQRTGHQA